jgi:hypothetical protein
MDEEDLVPGQCEALLNTNILIATEWMRRTNAERDAASAAFDLANGVRPPSAVRADAGAAGTSADAGAAGDLGHVAAPAAAAAAGATTYVISARTIRQVSGLVVEVALKMQEVAISTARIWKMWVNYRNIVVIECSTDKGLYSVTVDRDANIISRSWDLLKSLKLSLVDSDDSVTVGQLLGISNISTKQIQNARAREIRKQSATAKKAMESANTALETLKGRQQHDQQAGAQALKEAEEAAANAASAAARVARFLPIGGDEVVEDESDDEDEEEEPMEEQVEEGEEDQDVIDVSGGDSG